MEVSAPGKILLLGGYAVLEGHPSLSIAITDTRDRGVVGRAEEGSGQKLISREYDIETVIDPQRPLKQIMHAQKHEKVPLSAYGVAIAYLQSKGIKPRGVVLELDNSPIFGGKDEKSGLGSSAASTVALVASLLKYNGVGIDENRGTIHKLSQIAHSIATEKIGSGFDIATSTFGSIEYTRFAKESIATVSKEEDFGKEVGRMVEGEWKGMRIEPFSLEGFDIVAFNIKGGKTATVSSVRAVKRLVEYCPEVYSTFLKKQVEGESAVMEGIRNGNEKGIREGMHKARAAQRKISDWVGRVGMISFDPIEPRALTVLIDKSEEIEGVLAGRCPGSGGFDSVAFLVRKKSGGMIDSIRKIGNGLGLGLEYIDGKISTEGVKVIG